MGDFRSLSHQNQGSDTSSLKLGRKKITPIHFVPRFCSQCGNELKDEFIPEEHRERLRCMKCRTIAYLNPLLVAGAIPENDGKILLLKRGIEPARGSWTFPAGFMELGETVPEAAVRETREEIGVDISTEDILGIYSYKDSGAVIVVYHAKVTGGAPQQSSEAMEIGEFTAQNIPWEDLSFPSTRDALKDWVRGKIPPL